HVFFVIKSDEKQIQTSVFTPVVYIHFLHLLSNEFLNVGTIKPATHERNVRQKKSDGSFSSYILIVCMPHLTFFFLKVLTDLEIEHVLNISDGTNSYRENRSSVCCSDGPKTKHALKQVRDGSYWLLAIELPFSSCIVHAVRPLIRDSRTLARPLEWNSVGVPSEKPSEFIPTAKPVVCTGHKNSNA
ncbi:hypothetical protein AB205_0191940, partial [Aquarana catesbeiana]